MLDFDYDDMISKAEAATKKETASDLDKAIASTKKKKSKEDEDPWAGITAGLSMISGQKATQKAAPAASAPTSTSSLGGRKYEKLEGERGVGKKGLHHYIFGA